MNFLDPKLEQYVENHSEPESPELADLNRTTWIEVLNPRMIAGHVQGRVISMLSHMIQPKTILEIGTFTGYSALCWAEGLRPDGMIHTIDINEELTPLAKSFAQKLKCDHQITFHIGRLFDGQILAFEQKCDHQITFHIGNAPDVIAELKEEWDLVFLDADKSNYINYYNQVFEQVKPGGYIIADNVLWNGKVVDPNAFSEIDTAALLAFNKMVQEDSRVQNVLFPIRDGLMIIRKK